MLIRLAVGNPPRRWQGGASSVADMKRQSLFSSKVVLVASVLLLSSVNFCSIPIILPVAAAIKASSSSSTTKSDSTKEKNSSAGGGSTDSATAAAATAPSFFLQDATDGLCLAGEDFQRCTIDTLFYVVGSPGEYQIHQRPRTGVSATASSSSSSSSSSSTNTAVAGDEDGICISLKHCNVEQQQQESKTKDGKLASTSTSSSNANKKKIPQEEVKLAKCTHCGAKRWNILGDANTGYVLSAEDGSVCLIRDLKSNKAMTVDCNNDETPYTPLQLQFVSKTDIDTMSSDIAMFIAAAATGDKKTIQQMLKEKKVTNVNDRDWDQLTALIPAAQGGHLDIVKLLIKEGIDVNAHDKDQVTALMEAAIKGHTKIVEHLISSGAEVDASAQSGVTALWLAASEGKVDTVKLLLKKGADSNNVRIDGITALLTASVGGHDVVVKALLDDGAKITDMDKDELNALMNVAESGHVPTMKVIREAMTRAEGKSGGGSDIMAQGKLGATHIDRFSLTGYSALIIASAHGHKDAVDYLLKEGAKPDSTAENGVTALMYASAGGHIDVMNLLISAGADVNKKHSHEGSALLEACAGGSKEAIQLLIEKSSDYTIIDNDGVSALMSSSSQGHFEVVELLLKKMKESGKSNEEIGKFINLPSHSGGTSVMFSAASGATNVTKLLIENGADITLHAHATAEYINNLAKAIEEGTVKEDDMDPHVDGVTALHVAAQGGHIECAKLLLEKGAEVSAKDDENRSPLLLAVKGNYGELATLLIKKGANPNTEYVDDEGVPHNLLMDAIIVENEDFATLLISSGAHLYYVDETHVSTLLQASHRGLDQIVKSLLEQHQALGGEAGSVQSNYLDHPSDEGITPLIAAASEGHVPVIKALIEGKASVEVKDKDGTTALMAASARGHLEAVIALLDGSASIDDQNNDGHTALMFAYNGKNQVETLWERYAQFVAEAKEGETVDDKGTGPVIKDALDNHTKLVNELIGRGANQKLKDKEGHTAGDFDYHPDLDGEVMEKERLKERLRDENKNEL